MSQLYVNNIQFQSMSEIINIALQDSANHSTEILGLNGARFEAVVYYFDVQLKVEIENLPLTCFSTTLMESAIVHPDVLFLPWEEK